MVKRIIMVALAILFGLPLIILALSFIAAILSLTVEVVRTSWLVLLVSITCIVILIGEFKKG